MLRAGLWVLRQRRYAALTALMAVLAVICAGLGTFELHRYHEKKHDNAAIVANYHAATMPLSQVHLPLTGQGPAPGAVAIRYCSVTVTGTYLDADQTFVGNQSQGGQEGFWVITPLRTSGGVLLVARGYDLVDSNGHPRPVPAAPAGQVTLTARLDTAPGHSDGGRLPDHEVTAVAPAAQAARIGSPVYQAFATLGAHQPGTAGLRLLSGPSLSNPTGGAGEVQLLSYVVQWYVFALLAVLAPFLFARAEIRAARLRYLGVDPDAGEFDLEFAERRAALSAAASAGSDGALVLRERTALAQRGGASPAQWARGKRLADRYGVPLVAGRLDDDADDAPVEPVHREDSGIGIPREPSVVRSAATPHRAGDEYHGSYNDYLWQLAMADGEMPELLDPPEQE